VIANTGFQHKMKNCRMDMRETPEQLWPELLYILLQL
jgi:hypothetical protein